MKNIPVRMKILIGFCGTILLMLVMLGVTVATSLDRNKKMDDIIVLYEVENLSNDILSNSLKARVEMRTLMLSMDPKEAHQDLMGYLESALEKNGDLSECIQRMDDKSDAAKYRETTDRINELLNKMIPKFDTLQGFDVVLTSSYQRTEDAFQIMESSCEELFEAAKVQPLGSVEAMARVHELNRSLTALKEESFNLLFLYIVSSYDEMLKLMDGVEASIELAAAQMPQAAAINTMRGAMASYRAHAEEYYNCNNSYDIMAAEIDEIDAELFALIEENVKMITANVDDTIGDLRKTSGLVMITMIIIFIVSMALSALVAVYLGGHITRPLALMQEIMLQAGTTGNLNFDRRVHDEVLKSAKYSDEIGQSLKAFMNFIDRILYLNEQLEAISNRDLTTDVELLGDEDNMGIALKQVAYNLSEIFARINQVSSQVFVSSDEMARSAQNLAQASSNQIATTENISAAINEMNEQIRATNKTANETAAEDKIIEDIAVEGTRKMEDMLNAVQQISDASHLISKVNKAIDDIAFQTNILALNAAVEAARAGSHGKGFAVVADEVRNLAAKSAVAAKEASDLIALNLERTNLGLTISQDTAQNFTRIVDGIRKSSAAIQAVAEQNERMQASSSQLNAAMEQILRVVQENNTASEESVAVSEEMNNQAHYLQELNSQFKLKEQDLAGYLPPGGKTTGDHHEWRF